MTGRERILGFRSLSKGWDSYDAEPPSEIAIAAAFRILPTVQRSAAARLRIAPSVEGGIGFSFHTRERYADLEIDNDGACLALISRDPDPEVWAVNVYDDTDVSAALRRIERFFGGRT